ncbi:POU domain, class 6, transcription factor 1 [Orchesella cincta]|uniref:POU domain protein n=2 Tax=Collembola TaxID=30001 RepID=A0A1D2MXX1_ORCCI|nr:POU domain, class 6, transcription factor 1 [Orchesella cincta]
MSIMTQMILTIPLTQPGSPQNLMNTPNQNTNSPAIGAASGQSSSSPHSRSNRIQNRSHHHGLSHCNANSPPIASTVPPSSSPDYSGPAGTIPNSLLNLSPHLVNQSLGAHIPVDKMGMDRTGGMNGVRSTNLKRDNTGSMISSNPNLYPPKMSPCSGSGHDSDKGSDAEDSDQMVDGINLDEIKEFAKAFKLRRLSLGLTQTQVGQALSVTEGPAYSQSAICRFEKLDITPKSAQKIKPVLERWMKEAEDRYKNGHQNLNEFVGMEPSKKRKRRTSFTPQALEILNTQFERNTHPSGAEITTLAHQLGYEREVIRIWFCNKRQALKNTVRMMSKGSSPI